METNAADLRHSRGRRVARTMNAGIHEKTSPRRFSGIGRYGVTPSEIELARRDAVRHVAFAAPAEPISARGSRRDGHVGERTGREARAARKLRGHSSSIGALPQQAAVAAAAAGLIAAVVVPGHGGQEQQSGEVERVSHVAPSKVNAVDAPELQGEMPYAKARSAAPEGLVAMLKNVGAASKLSSDQRAGILEQPVNPVRITSPFGQRPDPWGGEGTIGHIGQDYATSCGQPVHAAGPGVVTQAESAGHSGNRVKVDHGHGLETTYNHNTELKVSVGDKVDTGDLVSLSGTTGNSTGCHLHFEVYVDGDPTDPADWV